LPEEGVLRSRLVCLALIGLLLLGGCAGSGASRGASSTPSPAGKPSPKVGGETPKPKALPTAAMDAVEKPIAKELADQVADQGLTLDYLDCPKWDKLVPGHLMCVGYFDGVTANVRVRLHAAAGGSVSFDAVLEQGVIATRNLVERLRGDGYSDVDCGDVPAYPTKVGSKLVCAVKKGDESGYVVATVTDRAGRVMIRDY
jgi:hypothetical protein